MPAMIPVAPAVKGMTSVALTAINAVATNAPQDMAVEVISVVSEGACSGFVIALAAF